MGFPLDLFLVSKFGHATTYALTSTEARISFAFSTSPVLLLLFCDQDYNIAQGDVTVALSSFEPPILANSYWPCLVEEAGASLRGRDQYFAVRTVTAATGTLYVQVISTEYRSDWRIN